MQTQGEFRSGSLKCYPRTIENEVLSAGAVKTVCAYRNYLAPSDLTNCSILEANNATYIIIDSHSAMTNRSIELSNDYIGKEIEVLESYNFALKSDVVSSSGVTFEITSSYGCAVLKIK